MVDHLNETYCSRIILGLIQESFTATSFRHSRLTGVYLGTKPIGLLSGKSGRNYIKKNLPKKDENIFVRFALLSAMFVLIVVDITNV